MRSPGSVHQSVGNSAVGIINTRTTPSHGYEHRSCHVNLWFDYDHLHQYFSRLLLGLCCNCMHIPSIHWSICLYASYEPLELIPYRCKKYSTNKHNALFKEHVTFRALKTLTRSVVTSGPFFCALLGVSSNLIDQSDLTVWASVI